MESTLADRFWSKVEQTPDHWLWTGSSSRGPQIAAGPHRGHPITGHRAAWLVVVGPIPPQWMVRRLCDERLCVNPAHCELAPRGIRAINGRKLCSECRQDLDLSRFSPDTKRFDGYHPQCRDCRNEYHRRRVAADPRRFRRNMLLRQYGMSLEDFEALLRRQRSRCAICRQKFDRKDLCIDHDHNGGGVRGLLCGRCNSGIGFFDDDPTVLRSAADYIDGGWTSGI